MNSSMRLQQRHAIVTGAGSGIGQASARGIAYEGAGVVVADIDYHAADVTAASIKADGGRAIAVQVDVSKRSSVQAMVDAAIAAFGRIDILHSNAGISPRSHFLDTPQEEWDRVVGINLTGQFICGQITARHMAKSGGGSIINTASQLAEGTAHPNCAHYLASKGGSRMLTRAMAIDLAPHNIRVNALAPGVTATNINRQRVGDPEWKRAILERIPLARIGKPED